MTVPTWLPLALAGAFCVATADAVTKRYLNDYRARELVLVRFAFAGLILAPLLPFFWPDQIPPAFWRWLAVMLPLEVLALLLYMLAIRDHPLALTIPYLAFTPAFMLGTAYLILGEAPTLRGGGGVLLVMAGAYLLNLNHWRGAGWSRVFGPLRALFTEPGARLMLGTAFLYSITATMTRGVLRYVPPDFFAAFYFSLLGAVALALFGRGAGWRVLGRRPAVHLAVGVLLGLMILAHMAAIQQVHAAYMIAVKRTSLLIAILYGAWWFGERHTLRHLVAGGVMLAGVFLIVS